MYTTSDNCCHHSYASYANLLKISLLDEESAFYLPFHVLWFISVCVRLCACFYVHGFYG